MSLIANHLLLGQRKPPTLIRSQFNGFSKTTPWNVTLGATPVEGALMIALIGANQGDNYTISGWTNFFNATGANIHGWYKWAGAGESTALNMSWTTGGTSQGGLAYFELGEVSRVSPIAYADGEVGTLSAVSFSYGSHTIPEGVFAIEINHTGDNVVSASLGDGYTMVGSSGSGGQRTRAAYKSYPQSQAGVNATWTYSAAEAHSICIFGINGVAN